MFPLLALLAACQPEPEPQDTAPTDTGEPVPLEHAFSFVVLADPHIWGGSEEEQDLEAAVEWVNAEIEARSIELVVVVGDITWSSAMETGKALLDELTVPYVPIIGDNVIQSGSEEAFHDLFAPQYELLASTFEDWSKLDTPVDNPEIGEQSWFQDFAFTHRGVRFLGLDWATRQHGEVTGETGDLHDFEGGTFPWFEEQLAGLDEARGEGVLMFSHHPMYLNPGGLNQEEMEALVGVTGPRADLLYADFAGHYHITYEEEVEDAGYHLYMTGAVWDGVLRVVEVWSNGRRCEYEHEVLDLDG